MNTSCSDTVRTSRDTLSEAGHYVGKLVVLHIVMEQSTAAFSIFSLIQDGEHENIINNLQY